MSYPHLNDDEQTDSSAHLRGISIHAGHHVHDSLADGDDHSKHCATLKERSDRRHTRTPIDNHNLRLLITYISERR